MWPEAFNHYAGHLHNLEKLIWLARIGFAAKGVVAAVGFAPIPVYIFIPRNLST